MDTNHNDLWSAARQSEARAAEVMDKFLSVAQPSTVYGPPTVAGESTVITASEVSMGMGFGFGVGGNEPGAAATGARSDSDRSGGGGGGGGGGALARPVAVIRITPDRVQVEPVLDMTKIGIAFLTTIGTMLVTVGGIFRGGSR